LEYVGNIDEYSLFSMRDLKLNCIPCNDNKGTTKTTLETKLKLTDASQQPKPCNHRQWPTACTDRQLMHASKDESTAHQQQKHTTSYLGTVKQQKNISCYKCNAGSLRRNETLHLKESIGKHLSLTVFSSMCKNVKIVLAVVFW